MCLCFIDSSSCYKSKMVVLFIAVLMLKYYLLLAYLLTCLFTYLLTYLLTHLLTYSLVYMFLHTPTTLFGAFSILHKPSSTRHVFIAILNRRWFDSMNTFQIVNKSYRTIFICSLTSNFTCHLSFTTCC